MALNVSNHKGMLSTDLFFLDMKSIPRVLYERNFTFIYHILIV